MIYNKETSNNNKEIKKEKKKRCFYCKKRLKILEENLCKCEKIFCPKHRLCHSHNCPLIKLDDHKKKIEKSNPKIQSDKVNKI